MLEKFWNEFKNYINNPNATYDEAFHFELNNDAANYLLELVLSGKKTATSSSLLAYVLENEVVPQAGRYSIVTDWDGVPYCVIETTRVSIISYKDMTYDIVKLEGEDDSLESWQRNHEKFFKAEGDMLGYKFNDEMPVVFEEFRVVYKNV